MSRPLPPPYLSVNLLPIMEKAPAPELTPTRLGFPNEFPYEFDSPSFSPGFTSPGDSTETEDESSDDEEDFLAGLTRRLAPSTHRLTPPLLKTQEKRQAAATSPQSTLSGLGSFSNYGSRSPILPSPPVPTSSSRRDNAWDVISAAAGEVARLKLGSYNEPHHLPLQTPESLLRRQNAAILTELQHQRLVDHLWLCSQARISKRVVQEDVLFENPRYARQNINALSNPTWLPPQHGVAPLKRPSAGTGVFLPRQYPTTTPPNSQKKPVNSPAVLQSKVNQHNLNFDDEFNNVVGSRRSQFDYECMLARNALLARQGSFRGVSGGRCLNQERRLPQDWMY
ncbi:PREDICTED: uncharacterized protein LOC104782446 [Camelina sativa]|uniref:Uncharacterized protein LOC104782446 n=1 Tax=Camelina sativa TaxID=90675 RepID=A0ABM0YTL5_CAMSA|nr:PREDICTED: uncharacterized protein LOC104782446 [Camelina sativa]